jgi:hypothetical protein
MPVNTNGMPPRLRELMEKDCFTEDEYKSASLGMQYETHRTMTRLFRMIWDRQHPVEEWQDGYYNGQPVTIQPVARVTRIESITVIIPVGCTNAILQLDQRVMQLYTGAALTVPQIVNMTNLGMILNENSIRNLTLAGAPTSQFFVSLAGHAMERNGVL